MAGDPFPSNGGWCFALPGDPFPTSGGDIYSVNGRGPIETTKEHGLNIYQYLTYLFEHLPNVEFLMKPELLEDFLTWAKNVQEHCKGI